MPEKGFKSITVHEKVFVKGKDDAEKKGKKLGPYVEELILEA